MSSSSSALGADSLASFIASSLPKETTPQLENPTQAIAVACHAGMLAVGFRLVGLGEDHNIEAHSSSSDAQPLPSQWNTASTPAFRYKHAQSSMEFLLKVSRLGNKTVVNGIAVEDDKPVTLNLTTTDFISASSFPSSPTATGSQEDIKHAITSLYISPSRLSDLGNDLRINIIQRLIPALQKEGYEDTRSTNTTRTEQSEARRNYGGNAPAERDPPRYDPLRAEDPPARPRPLGDPSLMPRRPPVPVGDFPPPDFEDEHQMLRRPLRGGPGQAPHMPGLGDRDLWPQGLGPNDPLRVGGVGPGLRGGGGGGMHPTFDDPLFGGRGGEEGYDPRAPPGARYDPTSPGDGPPFGAGGGAGGRFPGRGGFGSGNPFGGYGSGDFI